MSVSVIVSFLLHGGLLWWFLHAYQPVAPAAQNVPIARYVELIKQNPREFTEAPGAKLEKPSSLNAPLSDAHRKATAPEPTGVMPTRRPGDGAGLFIPPRGEEARPAPQPPMPASPRQRPSPAQNAAASPFAPATNANPAANSDAFAYRESRNASPTQASAAATGIDWKSAIKDAARTASIGRPDGLDGAGIGGENGRAEQGPLSFETQWYDWGDYAQSMVSRIRVNWYENMPPLFRTGIGGVVTIRFTIHRDGHITDVIVLESSGHPPYDQAAKKAIEQSSPLRPLPEDFPNPTERVTAMFYYNMEIPSRGR
ncbi:MAG TPA: TonB family protein [Thermoanaerobaculia bacterium]|nr:TonB family protein [Thermoanaerobaculia bacterium]